MRGGVSGGRRRGGWWQAHLQATQRRSLCPHDPSPAAACKACAWLGATVPGRTCNIRLRATTPLAATCHVSAFFARVAQQGFLPGSLHDELQQHATPVSQCTCTLNLDNRERTKPSNSQHHTWKEHRVLPSPGMQHPPCPIHRDSCTDAGTAQHSLLASIATTTLPGREPYTQCVMQPLPPPC